MDLPLSEDAREVIQLARQSESRYGISTLTTGHLLCALWLSDVYKYREVLHKAIDLETFTQVMLELWGIRTGVAVNRYNNRLSADDYPAYGVLSIAWDIERNFHSPVIGLTSIAHALTETEEIRTTLQFACKRLAKSFQSTLLDLQNDLVRILEDDYADRAETIAYPNGADMNLPMSDSAWGFYQRSLDVGRMFGVEKPNAPCLLYTLWTSDKCEHSKLLREAIPLPIFRQAMKVAWGIHSDDERSVETELPDDVRYRLENEPLEVYRFGAERAAKKVRHKEVSEAALLIAMLRRGSRIRNDLSLAAAGPLDGRGQTRLANLCDALVKILQEEARTAQNSVPSTGKEIVMVNNSKSKWIPRDMGEKSALSAFANDLTVQAFTGELEEVVGRDKEIAQSIEVLSRRTKKNPILVGEAGTGKTAIVHGIAARIVAGDVPDVLMNTRVFTVDMTAMVAGTTYRGDFEKRMKALIDEATKYGDIIFIDETHTVVGVGKSSDSALDASNMLKPGLASGRLSLVGATTLDEYRKHIEKDAALVRRFSPVRVGEPDRESTLAIMNRKRELDQEHHNVVVTDEAIEAALTLSIRYIPELFLPDKSIDLMDKACARVNNRAGQDKGVRPVVDASVVTEVVAEMTGVPVDDLNASQRQKLRALEQKLQERVIGQDEAVRELSRAVRRVYTGYSDPNKPSGSFFLLGPTGVGKTVIAKALNRLLFDNDNLIRIDMSEYGEKHAVNRLVGAPPGYVGYDDAGQLTEAVRRRPYSVVLFDEIEKAHPDVFDILLQVLDDGRLTDGQGRTTDFRNCIILFTSNIGVSALDQGALGFGNDDAVSRTVDDTYDETDGVPLRVMKMIKARFKPEFLNRLDRKILFNHLTPDNVREIVDIELATLIKERPALQHINLDVTSEARDLLAQKGFHKQLGARPLKRVIDSLLIDELSDLELSFDEGIPAGSRVLVDAKEGKLAISIKEKNSALALRA